MYSSGGLTDPGRPRLDGGTQERKSRLILMAGFLIQKPLEGYDGA